jgi:methionine-rich copper-binding protein CopC
MRNLKKLLAVIVSVCVLATFTFPAFAAEKTAAEICEDLGVLKGDSSEGVTDTYLAKGTTRDQAAILYLRLIGKEDEAYAFEGEDNFADADQTWDNAKKALAYLKANPELGWQGVSEDKFDPKGTISAQQMYKVCLEALGYKQGVDFEWAEVFTFAESKGLKLIADVTEMTNNDVAIALVEALKLPLKDSKTTLIEDLVAKGVVTEAAAIAAGLIEAEPEKLEVVSVEADNLVRVVVTFNKAIDKDSIDDGDFEVDESDVDSDDVSLSDDKKVATLKLDSTDPMSNGDKIEIAISGIKAVDGVELADYEGEFTPKDKEAPTVESIEFTGPETVKVTFSEPIDEGNSGAGEVIIDGGVYTGSAVEGFDNSTDVTIDLGTELEEGEHTFKVKGFKDFAEYSNIVATLDVEYAAVDEAPSVEVKKATQSYVILKFERPVKDVEVDDFYQTYSTWKPLEVQNEDGDEVLNDYDYYDVVRLAFTDAERVSPTDDDDDDKPLPVGTTKIVVKDESVKDRWGNEIDGDIILTAEITADNVKPEVTKVTVESEKEIRVYFSEDVDSDDAEDDDSYTIKNSKGDVISASKWNVTYVANEKYAKISIPKGLDKGNYKITIEAIADTSISGNTLDTVTFDFEVKDKKGTLDNIVVNWVSQDSILYIKYDGEMDSSSVLNEDNYRISDGSTFKELDKLFANDGDVKLTMYSSKIVKAQFRNLTDAEKASIEGRTLRIGRVKDAAGNIVSDFSADVVIGLEAAPRITEIKKIAENKFELKVNQDLKSISSGAIKVNTPGNATSSASYKFNNDGDDTIITVTVPSSQKHLGTKGVTLIDNYTFTIEENSIRSMTGMYMVARTITVGDPGFTEFKDGVPPAFAEDGEEDKIIYAYDLDGEAGYIDHIIIKYTEDIEPGTVSKYTYEVGGYKVLSAKVVSATSMDNATTKINSDPTTGQYVIIEIEELDDDEESDIGETPKVTQRQSIEDTEGNVFEAQKAQESVAANNTTGPNREP